MRAGSDRRQRGLEVGRDRSEVHDGLDVGFLEHASLVGEPRCAVLLGDRARTRLGTPAHRHDLRAIRDAVELGQVVALRDVAGSEDRETQPVSHGPRP